MIVPIFPSKSAVVRCFGIIGLGPASISSGLLDSPPAIPHEVLMRRIEL